MYELRLILVALQFLTRIPVPLWVGFEPAWLQDCLRHFTVVGALVGAFAALVLWAAMGLWPPTVAAAVSVAATVWLCGGFHEDGLADTMDALGGAVTRERALVIMKDSRIGTYGALALVLALGLKVAATAAIVDISVDTRQAPWASAVLVWSHAASRAAPVALVWLLPYAGDLEHAKAKPLALRTDGHNVAWAHGWLALLLAALCALESAWGLPLAASWLAGFVTTALCMRWLRKRLAGFTGDTLGATQQLVELTILLTCLAIVR